MLNLTPVSLLPPSNVEVKDAWMYMYTPSIAWGGV